MITLSILLPGPSLADSIGLTRTKVADTPALVLTVDLSDPNVKVTGMVAPNRTSDRFDAMIRRTHPTAALTGTYFCERSLIPIGDIVVDGRLVHQGGMGTALCVTQDNQVEFIKPPRYTSVDWSQYDFVLCAGPRLVSSNKIALNPGAEGFRDPHLLGSATRLAVGVTSKNKLVFAATRCKISLRRMAMMMKALGCTDAINLDAGSSLGFYKGGKMLMPPHRKLTNLILIYDNKERYARFKSRLTPSETALR